MTGPEDLLTDALRDRVDDRDLPSTPLGVVVSRAHRMRRRARIRNGAIAVAVVAALATPLAIGAARQHDGAPEPVEPPTPTPVPDVRLAAVPLGDAPAVPWIEGSDYVAADGTRTTLPIADLYDATPYEGGFLTAAYGTGRITLLDQRLQTVWQRCGTPRFTVSQDGTRTAYTAGDCGGDQTVLHLGRTDGAGTELTQTVPRDLVDLYRIAGDTVVTCDYDDPSAQLVDFEGAPTDLEGLSDIAAVDEDRDLVAGHLSGSLRQRLTGAVVELATGEVRWSLPGWNLQSFSPDGSQVLAVRGAGPTEPATIGVFDSETGQPQHEFELPSGIVPYQLVWEDDAHLLMLAGQGRREALVRSTLDGALERTTPTAAYDPNGRSVDPFRIAAD